MNGTRRLIPLYALPLLVGLAACNAAESPAQATAPDGGAVKTSAAGGQDVVAVVNGKPLSRSLLDAYTQRRKARSGGGDPQAMLDELISQELLVQEAVKRGLERKKDVAEHLEQLRRSVLATALIRDYLDKNPVTDEDLKKVYESEVASNPLKEYKARHILVKDEADAKAVIAALDKGADFAALAKEKSTGPSGKKGGELGWFSPAQMVKPFADAVTGLEKGKYTKTPVHTQYGWHVVLLEDTRDVPPPTFEQLKDRLRQVMENRRVQDYLNRLWKDAKVEKKI